MDDQDQQLNDNIDNTEPNNGSETSLPELDGGVPGAA